MSFGCSYLKKQVFDWLRDLTEMDYFFYFTHYELKHAKTKLERGNKNVLVILIKKQAKRIRTVFSRGNSYSSVRN